jgi:hypothetical protein
MLSIQEVHSYIKLSKTGIVPPINCPFNEDGVATHIVSPYLNKKDMLVFSCFTCDTVFYPGLKTEESIKKSLKNHIL